MTLMYLILFLAACMDLKSYRIPNRLIIAGYLLGLIYQTLRSDQEIFLLYPVYAFFILLFTIPFFCMGAIGGGDCKLFSVCAMFTGFARTISIGIYAFLAAGAVSVILLAVRAVWKRFGHVQSIKIATRFDCSKKFDYKLHFSIYILLSAVLEQYLGGVSWV